MDADDPISSSCQRQLGGTCDGNVQIAPGKRGRIRGTVPPIPDWFGTSAEIWLAVVRKFELRRKVQSVTPVNQHAIIHCPERPRFTATARARFSDQVQLIPTHRSER